MPERYSDYRYPRSVFERLRRWFRGDSIEPEVTVVLPEPLASEVRALLAEGRRVEAVRLTREKTKINLLPAVRAVDATLTDRAS